MERTMNWKIVFFLLSFPLLVSGCGSKENLIILSPASEGSVGALEVETGKGSAILDEEGKVMYIAGLSSLPSEPKEMSSAESQELFHDVLQVHPLMPQSFLLYFQHSSDALTEKSQKLIPAILEAVKKRQSKDIAIIGHTDRTGGEGYNRILSMERAQVVYDILRGQNIKGEEMTILYHGEANPLVPTADNVAEPRNRRVEVMVR
jgi:outer membrane protein OmpA-like peptidoglycan-associated protein